MSLTGDLEDLPLLDILQIVSFSKKTGFLSIGPGASEGAIVFDAGFVVAAFNRHSPPLDPRAQSLPPEKRDGLLRGRIELALQELIRLRDGEFDFSLTERTPTAVGARDITGELLSEGINAQELLLDLARGMDEDRRDSTAALEVSFAEPPPEEPPPLPRKSAPPPPAAPAPAPAPAASPTSTLPITQEMREAAAAPPPPPRPAAAKGPKTVLLVDDEEDVRRVLGEHLARTGCSVVEAGDPDSAVKKGLALSKAGEPFLLVVDLGMPATGGASFQGGFEVVKRLQKQDVRPVVLLMTDSLPATTQTRAKQLGIESFVFKPGLSKLDPEQFDADLRAFAAKIANDVLPRMKPAPAAPAPEPAAPKAPPAKMVPVTSPPPPPAAPPPLAPPAPAAAPPTLAPPAPAAAPRPAAPAPAPAVTAEDLSRELAMLQQRLDELRRPQDPTQIAALIMTVTREFFERALLFLVKDEELRGVNGFGPTLSGDQLALLARDLVIPLGEKSIFGDVAAARRGFTGALPVSAQVTDLLDRIGRLSAGDAALLPLVTHRETIAVLYGDNPVTGRPPGRLDGLRVFINQAGIALENAFLHRKVHALTGQE
jgi:CheY-like chemotaxis protein